MDDKKHILLIDGTQYNISEMVVKSIGEYSFEQLNSNEISPEIRYFILKKLDLVNSNHIGSILEPEYFNGKGSELSNLVNLASLFANKHDYEKANKFLYQSIKSFCDIYNTCLENEKNNSNNR